MKDRSTEAARSRLARARRRAAEHPDNPTLAAHLARATSDFLAALADDERRRAGEAPAALTRRERRTARMRKATPMLWA